MPASLSDDELLNVPLGNLLPGELARAFRVTAESTARKRQEDFGLTTALSASQQHEQETKDQEREDLDRREELVLERIHEREQEIQRQADELDTRAIKLEDGRRAYVDGDRYRDAEGRELTGADRAQAEVSHLEQPHAATWQERQRIAERWTAIESVRGDVTKAQANGGPTENAAVDAADRKLQRLSASDPAQSASLPSYSTDYMTELSGLSAVSAPRPAP